MGRQRHPAGQVLSVGGDEFLQPRQVRIAEVRRVEADRGERQFAHGPRAQFPHGEQTAPQVRLPQLKREQADERFGRRQEGGIPFERLAKRLLGLPRPAFFQQQNSFPIAGRRRAPGRIVGDSAEVIQRGIDGALRASEMPTENQGHAVRRVGGEDPIRQRQRHVLLTIGHRRTGLSLPLIDVR